MATPTIRGHRAYVRFYLNGEERRIDTVTRFSVSEDSSFSRQYFVGSAIPQGDQSIDGWSGSFDAQVSNDVVDAMIDAILQPNQAGIAIPDITIVATEQYTDGTTSSYVYYDLQFRMSKDQGGLQEKVTKRLDFQASGRVRL